jgi:hypothetical protein
MTTESGLIIDAKNNITVPVDNNFSMTVVISTVGVEFEAGDIVYFTVKKKTCSDQETPPSVVITSFVDGTAIVNSVASIPAGSYLYSIEWDELKTVNVSSVTRSGSTANVTTSSNHNFISGQNITISGANEPEYNGTFSIAVTALNQFTYTVSGTPVSPATGTIVASGFSTRTILSAKFTVTSVARHD